MCYVLSSGCKLGRSYYRLEEKFNPTLNPDGPYVCLICQCVPVSTLSHILLNMEGVGRGLFHKMDSWVVCLLVFAIKRQNISVLV